MAKQPQRGVEMLAQQAQTARPLPDAQANNIQPEYESHPPFHPVAAIQRVIFNGKAHYLVPEDEYWRFREPQEKSECLALAREALRGARRLLAEALARLDP